jgi:hypothetical protein
MQLYSLDFIGILIRVGEVGVIRAAAALMAGALEFRE